MSESRKKRLTPRSVYDFPLYEKAPFADGDVNLYHIKEERGITLGFPHLEEKEEPTLMQAASIIPIFDHEHWFRSAVTMRLSSANRYDPFGTLTPEERRWLEVGETSENFKSESLYHLPSMRAALEDLTGSYRAGARSFYDITGCLIHAARTFSSGHNNEDVITIVYERTSASWKKRMRDDAEEQEILAALEDAKTHRQLVTAVSTENARSLLRVFERMDENQADFDRVVRLRHNEIAEAQPLRYGGDLRPIDF